MFSPNRKRLRVPAGCPRLGALDARRAVMLVSLPGGAAAASARERIATVAVFPVENLSGGSIPADQVRQFLMDELASGGISVLGDGALEDFMVAPSRPVRGRHRRRHRRVAAAGNRGRGRGDRVDRAVERRGSTEGRADRQARIDQPAPDGGVGRRRGHGWRRWPGFFELGIVNDYEDTADERAEPAGDSLLAYLKTGETGRGRRPRRSSSRRRRTAAVTLEAGRQYSVAVVPFVNLSERRNAGDVLALLFMQAPVERRRSSASSTPASCGGSCSTRESSWTAGSRSATPTRWRR